MTGAHYLGEAWCLTSRLEAGFLMTVNLYAWAAFPNSC